MILPDLWKILKSNGPNLDKLSSTPNDAKTDLYMRKPVKCPFKGTTETAAVKQSRLLVRKYTVYYGHVAVNATRTHHSPSPPPPPAYTDWIKVKMATEGQSEYESVLCVKPEVNVYRIPPRASNRAIRWGDSGLTASFWPSIRELRPLEQRSRCLVASAT